MTQKQQRFSNQQISTDLNSFKRDAIAKIYQGKPLTFKDGIFSDMIKDILETALGDCRIFNCDNWYKIRI